MKDFEYVAPFARSMSYNWYKKYLTAAVRQIVLPPDVYDKLENMAHRFVIGYRKWTEEDLQLQSNYPEALEWFLRKKQKNISA